MRPAVRKTLAALGISPRSYYRWLREEAWAKERSAKPPTPVSPYEALSEEKGAVPAYARRHPELRRRELAWRMVDEDVVYLSPSTVYRILREWNLVCPWRRKAARKKAKDAAPTRPDEVWSTDLMYVQAGGKTYYLITFLDDYSRYIVHYEVLLGMDADSVSMAAQKAIETLPKNEEGKPGNPPVMRSDNGGCYVSKEFRVALKENGLDHRRIQPHCPEENGLIERSNRTIRESLEEHDLSNLIDVELAIASLIRRYNDVRLHSALGYLPPKEYYRGDPKKRHEERRVKLFQARHRRRELNLELKQRTLPIDGGEVLS
jgi:transposase InsO family protein